MVHDESMHPQRKVIATFQIVYKKQLKNYYKKQLTFRYI